MTLPAHMKLVNKPQKISLFLGAGASAPFDFAPTRPFIKKLRARLDSTLNEFIDDLMSISHVQDIEHIIEILDAIVEHNTKLDRYPLKQVLQSYPLYLDFSGKRGVSSQSIMRRNWRHMVSISTRLKDTIEERLFDEYESNPAIYDRIERVYTPLFKLMEMCLPPKDGLEVFTTNFDTVIEDYLSKTDRYELIDGFRDSKWQKEEFRRKVGLKRFLRLYKLHGSVNWKQRYDKEIWKVPFHKRIRNSKIWKRNIVIYPASKEVPSEEPFETLYKLFKIRIRSRSEVCIAIGFSFRDAHIDKIIADWLTEVKTSKLIIVSSSAKTARDNLIRRERRLLKVEKEGRIISEKSAFGKPETVERIANHLETPHAIISRH